MKTITRAQPERGLTALYRPACSQLFVIFQGGTGTLMMDPTEFMREAQLVDRNLLMLRDPRFTWFLRDIADNIANAEALVAYLARIRSLIAPRECYFVGTCMGAWAAMYYAHRVGVDEVWAFAPGPPAKAHIEELNSLGVDVPDLAGVLRQGCGATKYRVYYCADSDDRVFCESLMGCPGVTLTSVPGSTHRVLAVLKEQGKLKQMFPPLATRL